LKKTPGGLGKARSPTAKHFDAIYAGKNVGILQKSPACRIQQLSAELIVCTAGHV